MHIWESETFQSVADSLSSLEMSDELRSLFKAADADFARFELQSSQHLQELADLRRQHQAELTELRISYLELLGRHTQTLQDLFNLKVAYAKS